MSQYYRIPQKLQDKQYEVEKIVGKRKKKKRGNLEYLVKWEGYSDQYNEWIPIQNLTKAMHKVAEFEAELDELEEISRIQKLKQSGRKSAPVHGTRGQQKLNKIVIDISEENQHGGRRKRQFDKLINKYQQKQKPQYHALGAYTEQIYEESEDNYQDSEEKDQKSQNERNQKFKQPKRPFYTQQQQIEPELRKKMIRESFNEQEEINEQQRQQLLQNQEDDQDINFEGGFELGDEVERILQCKQNEEGIIFDVEWKERENGIKPFNSKIESKLLREFCSDMIINFYESKLKFVNINSNKKPNTPIKKQQEQIQQQQQNQENEQQSQVQMQQEKVDNKIQRKQSSITQLESQDQEKVNKAGKDNKQLNDNVAAENLYENKKNDAMSEQCNSDKLSSQKQKKHINDENQEIEQKVSEQLENEKSKINEDNEEKQQNQEKKSKMKVLQTAAQRKYQKNKNKTKHENANKKSRSKSTSKKLKKKIESKNQTIIDVIQNKDQAIVLKQQQQQIKQVQKLAIPPNLKNNRDDSDEEENKDERSQQSYHESDEEIKDIIENQNIQQKSSQIDEKQQKKQEIYEIIDDNDDECGQNQQQNNNEEMDSDFEFQEKKDKIQHNEIIHENENKKSIESDNHLEEIQFIEQSNDDIKIQKKNKAKNKEKLQQEVNQKNQDLCSQNDIKSIISNELNEQEDDQNKQASNSQKNDKNSSVQNILPNSVNLSDIQHHKKLKIKYLKKSNQIEEDELLLNDDKISDDADNDVDKKKQDQEQQGQEQDCLKSNNKNVEKISKKSQKIQKKRGEGIKPPLNSPNDKNLRKKPKFNSSQAPVIQATRVLRSTQSATPTKQYSQQIQQQISQKGQKNASQKSIISQEEQSINIEQQQKKTQSKSPQTSSVEKKILKKYLTQDIRDLNKSYNLRERFIGEDYVSIKFFKKRRQKQQNVTPKKSSKSKKSQEKKSKMIEDISKEINNVNSKFKYLLNDEKGFSDGEKIEEEQQKKQDVIVEDKDE